MDEDAKTELEIQRFKNDIAVFSGHYTDFVVIAKTPSGRLHWKSTDKTWGLGACRRFITVTEELDRLEERDYYDD